MFNSLFPPSSLLLSLKVVFGVTNIWESPLFLVWNNSPDRWHCPTPRHLTTNSGFLNGIPCKYLEWWQFWTDRRGRIPLELAPLHLWHLKRLKSFSLPPPLFKHTCFLPLICPVKPFSSLLSGPTPLKIINHSCTAQCSQAVMSLIDLIDYYMSAPLCLVFPASPWPMIMCCLPPRNSDPMPFCVGTSHILYLFFLSTMFFFNSVLFLELHF